MKFIITLLFYFFIACKSFAETEKNGPLVARVTNSILTPTYYSPLR